MPGCTACAPVFGENLLQGIHLGPRQPVWNTADSTFKAGSPSGAALCLDGETRSVAEQTFDFPRNSPLLLQFKYFSWENTNFLDVFWNSDSVLSVAGVEPGTWQDAQVANLQARNSSTVLRFEHKDTGLPGPCIGGIGVYESAGLEQCIACGPGYVLVDNYCEAVPALLTFTMELSVI